MLDKTEQKVLKRRAKMLDILKRKVQKKINEMLIYSSKTFKVKPIINTKYNLNSIRVLGRCLSKEKYNNVYIHTLTFNPYILSEYKEIYINEIVVHEVVHAIVKELYPNNKNGYKKVQSHGKEFKAICSHFGIDGKATTKTFANSIHLKGKYISKYKYTCGCNVFELSKIRHNRIQKGAKYSCLSCKNILVAV